MGSFEPSMWRPAIRATNEIRPVAIIQMIQQSIQFYGFAQEDPNEHIANFMKICDTFQYSGVSDDAFYLRFFSFSLQNRAKSWLSSLPRGTIKTWDDMIHMFLEKYSPPVWEKFMQGDFEPLYEAWERFKDALRRYPHHGLQIWEQVKIFYDGATTTTRNKVDFAAGGTILDRTPNEVYELIEKIALDSYSEAYNQGWRNHPNFPWREDNATISPSFEPPEQERKPNLDDFLAEFMMVSKMSSQAQEASMKKWETQFDHHVAMLSNETQGSLSSSTEENPKEQVQAVVPGIGKELEEPLSNEHDEKLKEEEPILVNEQTEKKLEGPKKEQEENDELVEVNEEVLEESPKVQNEIYENNVIFPRNIYGCISVVESEQIGVEVEEIKKIWFEDVKEEESVNSDNIKRDNFSRFKPLPLQFNYTCFDDNAKFLLMFCSSLIGMDKEQLWEIRRRHKKKEGMKIGDIKGINFPII